MTGFLGILVALAGLANLVLAILVLIKLFQKEGTVKGILGLICLLYTFIWGWMKHKEQQITTIMYAWTACLVIVIILQFIWQGMVQADVLKALQ
jgi:drug/metabolite transporter (DMT)-like permease